MISTNVRNARRDAIDLGAHTSDDPADYGDGYRPAIIGLGDVRSVREIMEDAVSNVERVEDLAMDLALFAHDQHASTETHALARTIARELPAFLNLCQRITP